LQSATTSLTWKKDSINPKRDSPIASTDPPFVLANTP